jgi:hypothetical protein
VSDDPVEQLTELAATAAERATAYADVWRSAIERNAAGAYAGADLLADAQALWGMAVADWLGAAAAVARAVAPPPEER